MWSVPFLILGCFVSKLFSDKGKKLREDAQLIEDSLNECFAELGFGKKESKPKAKYRMKEVENEGELFFTDATDFDEAFKL